MTQKVLLIQYRSGMVEGVIWDCVGDMPLKAVTVFQIQGNDEEDPKSIVGLCFPEPSSQSSHKCIIQYNKVKSSLCDFFFLNRIMP